MGKVKYTPEILEFIRSNTDKGCSWVMEEIKQRYGLEVTYIGLRTSCKKKGIKLQKFVSWRPEIYEFVKENHDKLLCDEMLEELKRRFNFSITKKALYSHYHTHNYKAPQNIIPRKTKHKIGDEVKYGLNTYVKYRDLPVPRNAGKNEYDINWMNKTRWVYIQHYGSIPPNYYVIQLDGNRENYNIDNLRAIPKSIMPKITKKYGYGIITEAMIEVCMLEEDLRRLENGSN